MTQHARGGGGGGGFRSGLAIASLLARLRVQGQTSGTPGRFLVLGFGVGGGISGLPVATVATGGVLVLEGGIHVALHLQAPTLR